MELFEVSRVRQPLVVILGIGKYNTFGDLKGVLKDYRNIIYATNYCNQLPFVYQTKNNQLIHEDHRANFLESYIIDNAKTEWTKDEIKKFNDKIKQKILSNPRINYDCLLYFISCRCKSKIGDSKNHLIYDSNGEKITLKQIMHQFSNQNCPQLS